jgi:hypothetical protein
MTSSTSDTRQVAVRPELFTSQANAAKARCSSEPTTNASIATPPEGWCSASPARPGWPSAWDPTLCAMPTSPRPWDAGVPVRDVQEAASHADPRTTVRYDRARVSLDRHATYVVATVIARAAR